jgi:hypothetical protein
MRVARGAITDTNGSFILDSVPPGSYTITSRKEGYANDVKDVYVSDSASDDLEIRLSANIGLTLNVVDARDNRPISARAVAFDAQGRIADETRMSIFGSDTATKLTLSVAPGQYTVTVSSNDYAPRTLSIQSPSTQTVRLSPGGTIEVRSKHSEGMRIRLIDATGQPYPRMGNFPPTRELLPSPGTTRLANIAPGVYTLQLLDHEVVVDGKQIVVQEDQTVTTDI